MTVFGEFRAGRHHRGRSVNSVQNARISFQNYAIEIKALARARHWKAEQGEQQCHAQVCRSSVSWAASSCRLLGWKARVGSPHSRPICPGAREAGSTRAAPASSLFPARRPPCAKTRAIPSLQDEEQPGGSAISPIPI